MYPTIYHAFLDLFGVDWPVLKFLNSFGFFVAIAFVAAHYTLAAELRRKTGQGLLRPTFRKVIVGSSARPMELATQALIGFVLGWKGLYMLMNTSEVTADPPGFLLSGKGNFIGGIVLGAVLAWAAWREKEKKRLKEPEERTIEIPAVQHAGNITMTALLWGFIGAKLFSWLEDPQAFIDLIQHPSAKDIVTGLTMYGGLILAGIAVMLYFRRNGIAFWPGVDSAAPGVLLAYGIGRIGCQVSGDGDWGIASTSPAPSWLPDWMWSYDYPNNVNAVMGPHRGGYVGERITEGTCFPDYCTHLVPGVYPTPLYEAIACVLLFCVLWFLRKRINTSGVIFSLFLIADGAERFLIEKIRVNDPWLGSWTQAEVIGALLVLGGCFGWWWFSKNRLREAHTEPT